MRPRRSIRSVRSLREGELELESLSELLGQAGKFFRAGKGAKHHEDLLPISQIGILNDIG
jgi:hypothetical protein